ncbi:MAG: RagB/SusD family nutrient uptake outer membrane protein [Bacteroidales bacterium]|nr:RagB/SusD family nutrient uptake outer membrane protein [Bacteroidales bacterium]
MKFNKFYKILSVVVIITAMTACSKDFLETDPLGKAAVSTFYKTDEDATMAVMATYDILQWMYARDWNSAYLVKTFPSDESLTGGGDAGDQPPYQELDIFTYSAGNPTITSVYQSNFYGVYRANLVINNVVNENDYRNQVISEAKFLRAYFYFELVSMFGSVPLNLVELAPSEYQQPPAPVADIWAQIEQDLKDAIAGLPAKSAYGADDVMRASKGAAQALLGKAYLYQEKWADAAAAFDQVIASGEYELSDDYSTLFLKDQELGVESIFEVMYVTTEGYDWGTFQWGGNRAMENNIHWQLCGPRGDYFNAGESGLIGGWGFNYPQLALYQTFVDAGDEVRRNSTLWSMTELEAVGGGWSNPDSWGWDGCIRIKYATRMSETSGDNGAVPELNYGTNVRLLRYADVLLMAAEAKFRAGNEAGALVEFNKVRERAQLNSLSALTFEDIVVERQLELSFEAVRFLDLIRWGLAPQVLGSRGFVAGKHELYPIPLDELRNNQLMVQNPNY